MFSLKTAGGPHCNLQRELYDNMTFPTVDGPFSEVKISNHFGISF